MHPDIELLLEVQQIDAEILELQSQLDQYPGIWDEVKRDLRTKTDAFERAGRLQTSHDDDRKRIETDLRDSLDKLKKYQAQQMLVKTSKELTAIDSQIESLKNTVARLEEEGRALVERDEKVRADLASTDSELSEAKAKAKVERERIREQVASKRSRIEFLQAERKKAVGRVPDHSFKLYERTRRRHPSDAIVAVRNGSCEGCHFALLPNRLVELHQGGASMVRCDNCGRILSHDETPKETEATA